MKRKKLKLDYFLKTGYNASHLCLIGITGFDYQKRDNPILNETYSYPNDVSSSISLIKFYSSQIFCDDEFTPAERLNSSEDDI